MKPRMPIAQMCTTPGPAYALPTLIGEKSHDPRSVHMKHPAYSFGVRHGKFKDSFGPGPSHFPNPRILRDGLIGIPQYSLYSRPKDIKGFMTPGPGAHNLDKALSATKPYYPAYSFGGRHQNYRTDKIPGANTYSLPPPSVQSNKPQGPSYSLRGPGNCGKNATKTPGPGHYGGIDPNIYKSRAPGYSLTSRNVMPGDTVQKPGPGAHKPDMAKIKDCQPAFSFGIRHSDYMTPLIVDLPSIECGPCD